MTTTSIKGRKGGGNQTRTPVEAPDSIQSIARAKVLIALGEGEFAGGLDGKNIFLGDSSSYTPIQNADGSYNFNNVKYEFRSGTQDQSYIQGFPGIENELQVSYELKQAIPYVRSVSNTQLSALRIRLGWPTLLLQKDNGDKVGTRVEYAIDLSVDGGAYETVVSGAVDDKTTTLYERSHRINLPKASTGWQLRVRRITADSTSINVVDLMRVVAVTEIIDAKLRYTNTALLYVEFDARQFPNGIPQIMCSPKGRIIRVPDTYDPETRTYSGTWEGGFKWAWTDNPAWIYYDIILNERFGLGQRIDATQIDRWELYRIAQYCDQPVPDGKGGNGMEPRFRCNVYIQDRNDAWTVLRDLAGVFRGMTYWGDNKMYVLADMPRDVWHVYNHASVVDGKFTFADPSETTRNTVALVNWSDPANHYKDTPEPVYDNDLAMRFDYRQLEMTAIGCTRQSEANRRGRWSLLTNGIGEVVTFSTGLDVPPVGEVIGVAANELAGRIIGGRVSAVSGRNITLDRAADVRAGNRLFLNLPSGIAQARTVQSVNGSVVTVTTAYSEVPEAECNWGVDADDLFIALFRVTGTRDNNNGTYEVTGTTYSPDIYHAVDTGARLDERPVSVIPPGVQAPPEKIVIESYTTVNQNIAITTMRVAWDSVNGALAYEAEWRRDSGNWVSVPRTSSLGFEVQGIYSGRYLVRVRAVNSSDVSSIWATSPEVELKGKTGAPPVPVNFRTTPLLWGVQLDWDFPANTADTLQTEIQYSTDAAGTNAMLLTDVPYPQHMYQQLGLKAGVGFWYRARLVDRTGNQSAWTDFIQGSSSSVAADYLVDLDNQIKGTDTYKDLVKEITDISDDIQSARDDISTVTTESAATKAGLAKEVTDRKKAITDEAAARGQALLTEKNERAADISNVNQTIQTTTDSLAQQIAQVSAGTGSQFDPAKIWYFDSTAEGWTGNGTPTIVDGWIRPANHATDPWVASPGSLAINSSSYRFVKLRIKKVGSPGWAGQLRWRGTGGFNDTNMYTAAEPAYDANGIATVEFDNIPWLTESVMNQFRLDLSGKQDATNYYLIDWVALGRPTPGAGMAALQQETTARVSGDQAEATARETLATQIRGGYTGDDPSKLASGLLFTERQARITAQQAEVTERTKLETKVNDNNASVTQELATLTNEQEAQATSLSGLETAVGKNTAAVTRIDKAVSDNDKAQTTALAAVKATTDQNTADISTETTARTDGDSALGRRIDTLKVDVDGNTASRDSGIVGNVTNALATFKSFSNQRVTFAVGETKTMAEITEARRVAADATSAVAEQVTTLKATVEDNGQTTTAAITRIDKAAADLKSATALSIEQVKAEIDDTSAAVQTTSEAVADISGKLSAQWGVKVQVEANGVKRIAGIQLGIDATGSSNFLISADTFALYNPTTNGQELVFAATGGQMFMRSVFIQDGSIDNGKIGNYIQSSNWDGTGNVGWHINKSGYATFNGVTVRGTIYATSGSFTGTVYATDGSFKGTVEATSFVGDVANVGIAPDVSVSGAATAEAAITFTDSSASALTKSALLEAMVYISSTSGTTTVDVALNINGDLRFFSGITVPAGTGGLWMTVRHAVRNITSRTVTARISITGTGTAGKRIAAPTLTITRGAGSFS